MLARFKMAHSKTSPESFHNRYVLSERSASLVSSAASRRTEELQ
jgi:hypothetical protein